jgi:hypothetical protein
LLEHLHFDEVVPQLPKTVAEQHMARIRSCAQRHFPAESNFDGSEPFLSIVRWIKKGE